MGVVVGIGMRLVLNRQAIWHASSRDNGKMGLARMLFLGFQF
jgi:hypothetical protein